MNEFKVIKIEVIVTKENGEDDQRILTLSKTICPRKGEYLWMPFNWEDKGKWGTRSFIVEDVAHHMPYGTFKGTYDSIVVYCKPVKPKQA